MPPLNAVSSPVPAGLAAPLFIVVSTHWEQYLRNEKFARIKQYMLQLQILAQPCPRHKYCIIIIVVVDFILDVVPYGPMRDIYLFVQGNPLGKKPAPLLRLRRAMPARRL